jgi:hypothetical protein
MHYDQPLLNPTRGTIVIDSNALFDLTIPIPEEYKLNPNENVSVADLFFHMAQHGWSVVIPEMVAYESAQMLRDGSSVSRIFNSRRLDQFIVEDFLAKVPNSAGNIKIAPPSAKDNSSSALYIRHIWKIHQSRIPEHDKRKSIMDIHRRSPSKDFGEQAAIELIRLEYKCDPACFFLTNDRAARRQATDQRIPVINCYDFLKVAETENLLGKLNLHGLSFEDYFNCVVMPAHRRNIDRPQYLPGNISGAYCLSSAGQAFAEAMRGIGDEMCAIDQTAEPEPLTEIQPMRQGPSGIKRFADRYGATFARRPGLGGS